MCEQWVLWIVGPRWEDRAPYQLAGFLFIIIIMIIVIIMIIMKTSDDAWTPSEGPNLYQMGKTIIRFVNYDDDAS